MTDYALIIEDLETFLRFATENHFRKVKEGCTPLQFGPSHLEMEHARIRLVDVRSYEKEYRDILQALYWRGIAAPLGEVMGYFEMATSTAPRIYFQEKFTLMHLLKDMEIFRCVSPYLEAPPSMLYFGFDIGYGFLLGEVGEEYDAVLPTLDPEEDYPGCRIEVVGAHLVTTPPGIEKSAETSAWVEAMLEKDEAWFTQILHEERF